MKEKSSKRIENKKKKMAALLEITKLNEYDRRVRKKQIDSCNNTNSAELEPSLKKQKTDCENSENNFKPPAEGPEIGQSGKAKLSGLEYLELKRMLREKTTKLRQQPFFKLREMGINASIKTDLETRVPLFLSDLQHLIMYSQQGPHSPYSPARWCALDRFNRINTTCVLILENICLSHFTQHEALFPFLESKFDNKLEVLSVNKCNSDLVKELCMVPLTSTQMKKFCDQYGSLTNAVLKSTEIFDTVRNLFPIEEEELVEESVFGLPTSDRYPRTQLLLSGWQMVEENFPLPIKGLMDTKYTGYVMSKDRYQSVTPFSKMFGIDCEMCKTTTGDLELTRVSVVDEEFNTFYDTLVKPENKITDYLTRFSGITHKMMKNVTTTLRNVQHDLRRLLPSDAILVGQSLSNDMHALKMMHPYVIDTSVIFNITGERSRKSKLKTLTEEFLSEKIQQGNSGHCSTEDSIASLKLTKLKLAKSVYFGDAVMGNIRTDVRIYPELGSYNFATSLLKQTTKIDKSAVVVGLNDTASKYKYYVDKGTDEEYDRVEFFSEKSCRDVVKKMCERLNKASLTMGHTKVQNGQLEGTKIFKNIDKWVAELYDKMATPGLFIVIFSGSEGSNGCCFVQLKKDV